MLHVALRADRLPPYELKPRSGAKTKVIRRGDNKAALPLVWQLKSSSKLETQSIPLAPNSGDRKIKPG